MKPVKGDVSWPKSHDPRAKAQPEKLKHQSSKDTRHWCKGKVGRRHLCAWVTEHSSYHRQVDYPNLLQLVCQNPGCNKQILQSYRLERAWRDEWGSRHDPSTVPVYYGPGLPADYGWGGCAVPGYVDVIGAVES